MLDHSADDALARAIRERDAALALARELADARDADAREALRHLRNVLSVVRVLAARTADEAETVEDLRGRLDGRLAAFTRGQAAGDPRGGRDLHAILGDELLAFGVGVGGAVQLLGPAVGLTARAAGLVALAAHELMAGGPPGGPIRVEWTLDDGLRLDWVERATPDGGAPLPFWVERALAYELKGRLSDEVAGGELRRRLSLPPACLAADRRSGAGAAA